VIVQHGEVTPAILLARKAAVPHDVLAYEHDPRAASYGLEAADLLGLDPATVFKTLVVDVDGVGLVCAVVPVTGMLDLKAVAEALGGRRAKMAEQQAAERATGYVVGGISPLAQKKPLPLVLDESAVLYDRIHVSAGRRGLEIALAADDLLRLTGGRYAPVAKDGKG
jgi:Cys-tRNA(Pro)/Cys-tRNA(Cys) deacylase